MKDSCVIKSNKYGLSLMLNPDISFEQLVTDVCRKFLQSKEFFGKVELVVSMEGRDLTFEEQEVILQAIELNSNIKIKLIEDQNALREREMLGKVERFYFDKACENAKIHFGNVDSGVITSDTSLLVLGDVRAQAEVRAEGNIIVFGKLEGSAHAGREGDIKQFILCKSLDSDDISIGSHNEEVVIEESIFQRFKRAKADGIIVGIWDNELIAEPLKNGLLKEIVSRQ